MLKKATCFAALMLMAACSSGSVSNDASKDQSSESAGQEQPVASNSDVEAYEQNETTLSGEQNNNDFVNKLDDKDLVSALREGGHVIYIRHAKTNKDWGDQISPELDLDDCNTQRQLSDEGKVMPKKLVRTLRLLEFLWEMSFPANIVVPITLPSWHSVLSKRTPI